MVTPPYRFEGAKLVAEKLIDAFTWTSTPEGYKYWETVYRKLEALAAGDPIENE